MAKQTEAQRLAEMNENKGNRLQPFIEDNEFTEFGYRPEGLRQEQSDLFASAAELRRLHQHELANNEWSEKTEWVQNTAQPHELGMHRADVLKQRIERLEAVNAQLLEALEGLMYWDNSKPEYDNARAAIAAAKGEA